MNREDWLVAFLYLPLKDGKENAPLDPVRIMKGLFLLRNEAEMELKDEFFEFVPYLYGPCSFDIYDDLAQLTATGLIDDYRTSRWIYYSLTSAGCEKAEGIVKALPSDILDKMKEIKQLISDLSFIDLLRYVYKRYPAYAKNSMINVGVSE